MARKKSKAKKKKVAKKKGISHKVVRTIPKRKELLMSPVQVKPEQLSGNYCNRAIINHSQREFVFDFLFSVHETTVLASRIITNPQHAKQIYEALGKNIGEYEKKFGKIIVK